MVRISWSPRIIFKFLFIIVWLMTFTPLLFADCVRSLEKTLTEMGRTMPAQTIRVDDVAELFDAVSVVNATGGHRTILLEDGEYYLESKRLYITSDQVAFRSRSGNRDAVKIWGQGMYGNVQQHVFEVVGDYFIAADMTIGEVRNHPIQIHGESDADFPLIHNIRIVNAGEQMLKVSYNAGDSTSSDHGVVEWCLFEYPAGIGPRDYIGGVDAHQAHNWIIRHNVFRHIRSPEANLAEHAIHFWSDSSQTLVEYNTIIDCDRGIGFGLRSRGHQGGIIRNNMVHTTRDVGIGLENSRDTRVYNNTVFTENYENSIEYRFLGTYGGTIINNLTNARIKSRGGGRGEVDTNITNAQASWFVDARNGDLHLVTANPIVVDQGKTFLDETRDIDCERRPKGDAYDIGADER